MLPLQVCDALYHMHSQRMMHRDIKPSNVFVTAAGDVKLGDLGLGRFMSSQTVQVQTVVGTPCYMSPEVTLRHFVSVSVGPPWRYTSALMVPLPLLLCQRRSAVALHQLHPVALATRISPPGRRRSGESLTISSQTCGVWDASCTRWRR